MLKQTLSISDNQQVKLQEIISNQENIIENSKVIERKYLELLNSYEVEKKANDKVRSMLKRQILKQTIFKYISIGAGVLTSGFLTYKLITK
jgi:L-fucose isomerase-like protein